MGFVPEGNSEELRVNARWLNGRLIYRVKSTWHRDTGNSLRGIVVAGIRNCDFQRTWAVNQSRAAIIYQAVKQTQAAKSLRAKDEFYRSRMISAF